MKIKKTTLHKTFQSKIPKNLPEEFPGWTHYFLQFIVPEKFNHNLELQNRSENSLSSYILAQTLRKVQFWKVENRMEIKLDFHVFFLKSMK